jgi:DNA helicase MCM8
MYAKANCNPVIGPQAVNVLRAFYIELRETNFQNKGSNPITMRQLESLVRLTQARAKCEMRNVCSENDALEVVELMRNSMIDLLANEDGEIDYSDSMNGSLIRYQLLLKTDFISYTS